MSHKIFCQYALALSAAVLSFSARAETETKTLPAPGFYNNAESPVLLKMIEAARESLDIEIYELGDADAIKAIHSALERGVRVRVVKEPAPLGSDCDLFDSAKGNKNSNEKCLLQKNLKDAILKKNGEYKAFNKDQLCADPSKPCFMHGKLVIADSRTALVSTGNFNSSNLCNLAQKPGKCNRDFSVIVNDAESVAIFEKIFVSDLNQEGYDLKSVLASQPEERVTASPHSLEPLVAFIASAKKSIAIQNQYLKEPKINLALIEKARAGIEVEISLASACSFAAPSSREKSALSKLLAPLEAAGASIRMLPASFTINGKPGYLHSKAIVVDEERAWVGSVNGSTSATSNNREFGVFFDEPAWVAKISALLNQDHASKKMETWQESLECKKDSMRKRPKTVAH